MNLFLFNIALAFGWMVLTDSFTVISGGFGFLLGYVALWLARSAFKDSTYFGKLPAAFFLAVFVLWELFRSSLFLARDVLTLTEYARPKVISVPLRAKTDAEITLLANLISLTPGTVSVDVSEDRTTLFVHSLYTYDEQEVVSSIQDRLEARILRLTRPAHELASTDEGGTTP